MDLNEAEWRKSSRSGQNGGNCVEVAALPDAFAVRDSKHPNAAHLALSKRGFQALAGSIKNLHRQP